MASTIQLKRGSGAPTSGDLTAGELGLDLTNKRIYSSTNGSDVVEMGANPTAVTLGSWTISVIANELVFDYNGTDVFKLKTTGEVVSANDVTAFGTI